MSDDDVKAAEKAAKEFLARIAAWRKDRAGGATTIVGTKASGAVRRASMDLTRVLAEMRRPT
jgi:hypothetical protein